VISEEFMDMGSLNKMICHKMQIENMFVIFMYIAHGMMLFKFISFY